MSIEDRAQEQEAQLWLANQTRERAPRLLEPSEVGYGPIDCVQCGAEVTAFRRQHGWMRCTACQSKAERRR